MSVNINFFDWQRCFTQKKSYQKKVAAIKSFEYSPLGKELKKQTSVVEKQYQKFNSAL